MEIVAIDTELSREGVMKVWMVGTIEVLLCLMGLTVFVSGCGTSRPEDKSNRPKAQVIGHGTQPGSSWLGVGLTLPGSHPHATICQASLVAITPTILDALGLLPSFEDAIAARPPNLRGHSLKNSVERILGDGADHQNICPALIP